MKQNSLQRKAIIRGNKSIVEERHKICCIRHRFIANVTVQNAIRIVLNSVWAQNQGPMDQTAP